MNNDVTISWLYEYVKNYKDASDVAKSLFVRLQELEQRYFSKQI